MIDRKKLFGMKKNELLLILTKQKGIRQVRSAFINLKQYLEPLSIHDRWKKRFLAKQKILEILKEKEKE